MAKYKVMTFSNPVDGRDEEFNDWYDNVHVPDALAMPEVVGHARYKVSMLDRAAAKKLNGLSWRYLNVWDLECDDPQDWIERATALEGNEHSISDAFDIDGVLSLLAEPL